MIKHIVFAFVALAGLSGVVLAAAAITAAPAAACGDPHST